VKKSLKASLVVLMSVLVSCGGGSTPSTPKAVKLTLEIPSSKIALKQDASTTLQLTIGRTDFDGPVNIKFVNSDASPLPDWLKADPVQIAAGATTGTMTIRALDNADLIRNACGVALIATSPATEFAYARTNICIQITSAVKSGRLDTNFADFGAANVSEAIDLEVGQNDDLFVLTKQNIQKLKANGQADTSFGTQGVVAKPFTLSAENTDSMAITANNKLIVVGAETIGGVQTLALAQYAADGKLDSTFGTAGKVNFSGAAGSGCQEADIKALEEVTVGQDGKIRAIGNCANKVLAITVSAIGVLETTYGQSGYALIPGTSYGTYGKSLTVDSTGRVLVVAKYVGNRSGTIVSRFNTSGQLDTAFDTDGEITLDFGTAGVTPTLHPIYQPAFGGGSSSTNYSNSFAPGSTAITVQVDNKILIAATAVNTFGIARLLENGGDDSSFGSNGRQIITPAGGAVPNFVEDIVLQKDNKILISGLATPKTDFQFMAVARLNTNGQLDTTWNGSGLTGFAESTINNHNGKGSARVIGLQSNGQIVLGGDLAIVRFFP
jgi:uncharacterized delta-60 repeat protein